MGPKKAGGGAKGGDKGAKGGKGGKRGKGGAAEGDGDQKGGGSSAVKVRRWVGLPPVPPPHQAQDQGLRGRVYLSLAMLHQYFLADIQSK